MSRINEVMSWLESSALVKIFGGGNLHTGYVSDRLVNYLGGGHLRQAVNALARYGDLLKVGGEERHDGCVGCAKLFTFVRARDTDRWAAGLIVFLWYSRGLQFKDLIEIVTETT